MRGEFRDQGKVAGTCCVLLQGHSQRQLGLGHPPYSGTRGLSAQRDTPQIAPLNLNPIVPSYGLTLLLSLFSLSDPVFVGLN